jgi:hypothetical protein
MQLKVKKNHTQQNEHCLIKTDEGEERTTPYYANLN